MRKNKRYLKGFLSILLLVVSILSLMVIMTAVIIDMFEFDYNFGGSNSPLIDNNEMTHRLFRQLVSYLLTSNDNYRSLYFQNTSLILASWEQLWWLLYLWAIWKLNDLKLKMIYNIRTYLKNLINKLVKLKQCKYTRFKDQCR